jgi:predicted Fe-Mo cluster-binding NifX family protein
MSGETNISGSKHFSGKIAIATNDGKRVTGHIGRCRSFMIYDLDGEKIVNKELRENVFTHHRMHQHHEHHGEGGGHNHTQLINGLKDCSYLISSGGGWRVVEDLKQNNITPIFSDVDLIEDAVNMFIKGELKDDAGLVCNHNEH